MQLRRRDLALVTSWGRLVVLFVLAAGFLTMHGFLAVSASADAHPAQQHQTLASPATDTGGADAPAASGTTVSGPATAEAATDQAGSGTAPDRPGPAEHHDLVAGCVVALVGVGLAGLALLSRRRCVAVESLRTLASGVITAIGPSAARWFPPRVALCVIRV